MKNFIPTRVRIRESVHTVYYLQVRMHTLYVPNMHVLCRYTVATVGTYSISGIRIHIVTSNP